tara:strand:+ start:28 stop:708 length:681 start_codon:yes stop_codon:yes gene_type:complete
MIKAFLHIATMGAYQEIFDELINAVLESKMLDRVELTVCIVGDGVLNVDPIENIKVVKVGSISDYEFATHQLIEDEINDIEENIKVLYFHGSGVTGNTKFKKSWRAYLTYFVITRFEECLKALDEGYDVCGIDWRTNPLPHYSGTFWWANSNYLKTLPKVQTLNKPDSPTVLQLRHNAEMYIGMNPNVKPRILHQSNVSQYEKHLNVYEAKNYINKISNENVVKAI